MAVAAARMSSVGQTDATLAAFDLARAMIGKTGGKLPKDIVLRTQAMLVREGYDPGPIDGVAGPRTIAAMTRLKHRLGEPI